MAKKDAAAGGGRGAGEAAGFTDLGRVKALIALMAENGLSEIELAEDKSRIVLRRGAGGGPLAETPSGTRHEAPLPAHARDTSRALPAAEEKRDANLVTVKSPMVGTFYAAASPDSDAYVSVGTEVEKDKTVVCVIEAMKMFNEIHADASGTVTRILVSNGQAVEFGQALFVVKPG